MTSANLNSFRRSMLASATMIALIPVAAFAQEADDAADSGEIVVTGTILRGAPPVGSNAITVGQEKIAETGATTANELLTSVPQVTNLFNNVPQSRLGVAVN